MPEEQVPLTRAQEVYLKNRKLFPEDPDGIRAKREERKRKDDDFRLMVMRKRREHEASMQNLAKAREARKNGK